MPAHRFANPPLQRTLIKEALSYLLCSALALGLDILVYHRALVLGLPLALAASLGFAAGVTCTYLCSVHFVFRARRLRERSREFALFVGIGLAGLLLTEILLWMLVSHVGLDPLPAKLVTASLVFTFNFGVRKSLLFSHARSLLDIDTQLEPLA